MLPLFFATNRIHYARYGTYYIQSLEHIESTHLGAREEIEDEKCTKVTHDDVEVLENWVSNHEEADTKLVALVKAANFTSDDTVMIRSSSGDIDVLALFLAHDFGGTCILVDNGTGKQRKIINITSSSLKAEEKNALLGMHAFSGNDYVSAFFFGKGKLAFWRTMSKNIEFIRLF